MFKKEDIIDPTTTDITTELISGDLENCFAFGSAEKASTSFESVAEAMAAVDAKSNLFENLSKKYDPHYNEAIAAIAIIKQFIIDRGLILYGGTAVDYALRLLGDNIYPDAALTIPDLDFYSPDSVGDAYALTKILYDNGYKSSRTIPAIYPITMRVDIVDNHFLADISYVPPAIFSLLPTIVYDGMKIIDPIFQKMDFHACLGYPFDNPPREVIFAKWKKYIARFNKLHKYYPTPTLKSAVDDRKTVKHEIPADTVLGGLGAYAVYMYMFGGTEGKKLLTISDKFLSYKTDVICLMSFDPEAIKPKEAVYTRGYINVSPPYFRWSYEDTEIRLYDIGDRLMSTQRIDIGDSQHLHVVSAQILLMQLLAAAHMNPSGAQYYYKCYEDIIVLTELNPTPPQLLPTVHVYGRANKSDNYLIAVERIKAEQGLPAIVPITPKGYYPERGNVPDPFDYNSNPAFQKNGESKL